jgi:hypothetical protein
VLGADGEETPVSDFAQALETAVGTKGWVILRNREPLFLPARDRTTSSAGNGWLKLRAAQGLNPVLIVEINNRNPFLLIGSGMSLVMEGLTIVARYPDQFSGNDLSPSPVILTGGPAYFHHCAFVLDDSSRVAGTRAVLADGGSLTVENCWFKGFDVALDIRAIGGITNLLKQTLTIPPTREAITVPSRPPVSCVDGSGWGIRVQFLGGGRAGVPRRLVLDHCTISGTGMLKLAGFSADLPLWVDARGCAIKSRTLMSWESNTPGIPLDPRTVHWQGEGNQLDISGPSWLLALSKSALDPMSEGIDRDHWLQSATERNPIAGPIQFQAGPGQRAKSPVPEDFTIRAAGPQSVGADPKQVGPQGRGLSRSY